MTRATLEMVRTQLVGRSRAMAGALALACAMAAPATVEAAPVITGAYLDLAAGTLSVEGTQLGSGMPTVTLGGTPLVVQTFSPTWIVAALPGGLDEGSYLLVIRTSEGKTVRFEVTADRESTVTYAAASGSGLNPTSVLQFLSAPVPLTVTSAQQRTLVTAFHAFGAGAQGAGGLNIYICYRLQSGGLVTQIGNGMLGIRNAPSTRSIQGITRVLTLAVGSYMVGMCGTGGPGWINNDWGTTTALIF